MTTKTVALDEESYGLLTREKRARESFSQTVKRLTARRGSILEFWGMWDEMSDDQVEAVRGSRTKGRKRDQERLSRVLQ